MLNSISGARSTRIRRSSLSGSHPGMLCAPLRSRWDAGGRRVQQLTSGGPVLWSGSRQDQPGGTSCLSLEGTSCLSLGGASCLSKASSPQVSKSCQTGSCTALWTTCCAAWRSLGRKASLIGCLVSRLWQLTPILPPCSTEKSLTPSP